MSLSSTIDAPWTVRRLLEWTTGFFTRKQVHAPRLSAEMLLGHVLGLPRIKLYTDYERPLAPGEVGPFRDLVKRAADGEPIAYLTGRAPFFNLEFAVTPDVLIPRPDTEVMVEHLLQTVRLAGPAAPSVLDLCTGSGCVACAVAHHLPASQVVAIDVSPVAVDVALRNVRALKLGDRVDVREGDLFAALDAYPDLTPGPFDVLLANPPYIPSARLATLDPSVRDFEPRLALDGGPDGLDLHRRIVTGAPGRVLGGGRIYLEIDDDQGDAARAIFDEAGVYDTPRLLRDTAGQVRVITATLR